MKNNNDILAQRLQSIRRTSLPDGLADSIMGRVRRRERMRRAGRITLIAVSCAVAIVGAVWGLSFFRPEGPSPFEGFFQSFGGSFRDIFGRVAAFVSTDHGKLILVTAVIGIFYLFLGEAVSARLNKKLDNDPTI